MNVKCGKFAPIDCTTSWIEGRQNHVTTLIFGIVKSLGYITLQSVRRFYLPAHFSLAIHGIRESKPSVSLAIWAETLGFSRLRTVLIYLCRYKDQSPNETTQLTIVLFLSIYCTARSQQEDSLHLSCVITAPSHPHTEATGIVSSKLFRYHRLVRSSFVVQVS